MLYNGKSTITQFTQATERVEVAKVTPAGSNIAAITNMLCLNPSSLWLRCSKLVATTKTTIILLPATFGAKTDSHPTGTLYKQYFIFEQFFQNNKNVRIEGLLFRMQ
mmetsp:Transcript_44373/g.135246  ORF Transcript_44373/g.135246 Transcript_44373/m.135246 type:complete len:107 (-) Transcript_44373:545-865(-)